MDTLEKRYNIVFWLLSFVNTTIKEKDEQTPARPWTGGGHCVSLNLKITAGNGGALHLRKHPPSSHQLFVIRGESRWCLICIMFWIVSWMFGDSRPLLSRQLFHLSIRQTVVLETSPGVSGHIQTLFSLTQNLQIEFKCQSMLATTITVKMNL